MRLVPTLLALLLASGCASEPDVPSPEASGAADEVAAASGAGGADCLVGTWRLDPASIDFDEIPGMSEMPDASFSVGETEGEALLVFGPDGGTVQRFEDFVLTIDATVGQMALSVANAFDGTAEATYAVEGDRITFTPGEADLTSTVTVNGTRRQNPFAVESIFESAERGRPTFDCSPEALSMDIYAPEADGGELMFSDARYTRVAG